MKELLMVPRRWPWLPALLLFLICGLRYIDFPGLYMDAVNPDYLAAHALHPALDNPRFLLPGNERYTFLGSYYHGAQNYYVLRLFLAFWGSTVFTIRLAQMLFGCIIIASSVTLVSKLTRSCALAMTTGFAAATDIAFIASFRDQNYIVLGGLAWLLVAVNLALPRDDRTDNTFKRLFFSGIFAGLSVYGYFANLFFLPALMLLVLHGVQNRSRGMLWWMAGLPIGAILYFVGYFRMYRALGGLHGMISNLSTGIRALNPVQSETLFERISHIYSFAHMAVSNDENCFMILGGPLGSHWGNAKFYLLTIAIMILLGWAVSEWVRKRLFDNTVCVTLLPLSFAAVALVFGGRLGAHHFSVLIVFVYITICILLYRVLMLDPFQGKALAARRAIAVVAIVLIGANLLQQSIFFKQLNETGGVFRSSNALTTMAQEAISDRGSALYDFPEWGFFTSFALLTENKVPYLIDDSTGAIKAAHARYQGYGELRLLYWSDADSVQYVRKLQDAGLKGIRKRIFFQRNGRDAFYMLTAHFD